MRYDKQLEDERIGNHTYETYRFARGGRPTTYGYIFTVNPSDMNGVIVFATDPSIKTTKERFINRIRRLRSRCDIQSGVYIFGGTEPVGDIEQYHYYPQNNEPSWVRDALAETSAFNYD